MSQNTKKGYTLLELAIVLVIVGVISAGALVALKVQLDSEKVISTTQNMKTIEDALLSYFAHNGYLPCPADLSEATTNATYGTSQYSGAPRACTTIAGGVYSIADGSDAVYMGAVPFKTLGISNDFMFDGWDNKFSYVVQAAFVNDNVTNTSCVAAASAADLHTAQYICSRGQASGRLNANSLDIEIWDYNTGRMINNDAVYVLISHGANGLGAFKRTADGSGAAADRNALPAFSGQTNERDNTNCDPASATCSTTAMTNRRFSIRGAPTESTFDDIVSFKTRNMLVYQCNLNFENRCLKLKQIDLR